MRKLMTYPVGIVLKLYMQYAFYLVAKEEKKQQRANHIDEVIIKKPAALSTAQ